jgi:hypothetical protein
VRQDLRLGSLFGKRATGLDYTACQELQAFICQIEALRDQARDLATVDELLVLAHEVLDATPCPEDLAQCRVPS